MRFLFLFLFLTFNNPVLSELIKPNPNISPKEVIEIQLNALKTNNIPFDNAGIKQTWEFAHPLNREYTGPIDKFILMMNSPEYIIMLNHKDHNIIFISETKDTSYFFIELTDKSENKFGFEWTVKKVLIDNDFKNCWMTIAVSQPILITQSI